MAHSLAKALEQLADLLDAHVSEEPDVGPGEDNFRCSQCEGCYECRFCVGCRSCERCNYCEGCEGCVACTQCRDSVDLEECTHSDHSRSCRTSRYLTLCFDCEDCTQCFACVGLSGQEFCVLNKHYSKRDYFELVKRLRAELEARAAAGFLPAFEDDPEAWFDALEEVEAPSQEEEATTPFDVESPTKRTASVTRGQLPPRGAELESGSPGHSETPAASPSGKSFLRAGRRPPRP